MTASRAATLERAKAVAFPAGIAIAATCAVLLVAGVLIPGLAITFDLHRQEFAFNFSLFVYAGGIFAGLVIASFKFRAVSVVAGVDPRWASGTGTIASVPWSRIVAGGALIVVGVISYATFGLGFTDDTTTGLWLYLGGPSSFVPSGLLPLVIGAMLVMYAIVATKVIDVRHDAGSITILERRPFSTITTSIPRDGIEAARLSGSRVGPRHGWIAIFFFQAWYLLVDGVSFLVNPHAFGMGHATGAVFVTSGLVQVAVMLVLTLWPRRVLEIVTAERVHELRFEPAGKAAASRATLAGILGLPVDGTGEPRGVTRIEPGTTWIRLVAGVILVGAAVASRVFLGLGGDVFRLACLLAGAILVVEAVARDVPVAPSRASVVPLPDGNGHLLSTARGSRVDEVLARGSVAARSDAEPRVVPRQLELFDHAAAVAPPFACGLGAGGATVLAASGIPVVLGMAAVQWLLLAGILALAVLVTVDPRHAVQVDLGIKRYQVLVRPRGDGRGTTGTALAGWAGRWRAAWATCRGQVLGRILEIVVATVAGLLAGGLGPLL